MTRIDDAISDALHELANPRDVDQALEKLGTTGTVRDLLQELKLDSIDKIDFIMALEESLDIEISDQQAEQFMASDMTLGQVKHCLQSKCQD